MIPFLISSLKKEGGSKIFIPLKILALILLIIILSGVSFVGKFFSGKKNTPTSIVINDALAWSSGAADSACVSGCTCSSSGCASCAGCDCGDCSCSPTPAPLQTDCWTDK